MEFWKHKAVKTEQSTAMQILRYKIRNVLKMLEIISALILVFWSTTRLPVAAKLLIEFVKELSALLLSTPSVFLIGNAIVLSLVAQSGTFKFGSGSDSKTDLFNESRSESQCQTLSLESDMILPEKVVALDEQPAADEVSEDVGALEVSEVRCYRRTQSEMVVRGEVKKELRRTRTEKCGMKVKKPSPPPCAAVDELSGDEFRRTVEAFIAKQQRFLRDENMALVLSN